MSSEESKASNSVDTNNNIQIVSNDSEATNNTSINVNHQPNGVNSGTSIETNMIEKARPKSLDDAHTSSPKPASPTIAGENESNINEESKSNTENNEPVSHTHDRQESAMIGESSASDSDIVKQGPLNEVATVEKIVSNPNSAVQIIATDKVGPDFTKIADKKADEKANLVQMETNDQNVENSRNDTDSKKQQSNNQLASNPNLGVIQKSIESSQGQSSHTESEQQHQRSLNSTDDTAESNEMHQSEINQKETPPMLPQEKKSDDYEIQSQSLTSKNLDGQVPVHPDRRKSALLLSHRKMILQRLKQCKSAAEKRLREYEKINDERNKISSDGAAHEKENSATESQSRSTAPKLPLKSNHVDNEATSKQFYERKIYLTRKEEIDEFKELSYFALSFNNRRQLSSSSLGGLTGTTTGGSTRNISLRTGSSVGNKMKAAVKTLTNNSGWASSSSLSVESNANAAANDVNQKMQSAKKQTQMQQRLVIPLYGKYNGEQQQFQNVKYPQEGGGNIVVGKTTSNATIIQNNHENNGIEIASMPTATSLKKSQQSKKVVSAMGPSCNYATSTSFKTANERLRGGVTMANNMTIVNGPEQIHHPPQPTHQQSSTSSQPGKKFKKQSKSRRSSSKRSLSAPATTSSNDSRGQGALNPQLHPSFLTSSQQPLNNNIGPVGGSNYPAVPISGHYSHHFQPQGLDSAMINAAHFRNGINQMIHPQQLPPRILCPETERLRKKRKIIETKLESLFKKRYLRSAMNQVHSSWSMSGISQVINGSAESIVKSTGINISSPKSSAFDLSTINSPGIFKQTDMQPMSFEEKFTSMKPCENQYMQQIIPQHQKSKPLSWKAFMSMGGQSACLLPQRRKTQWDFVLEEMRWLAVDFIEERKWKRASSSAISQGIIPHHSIFASALSWPSRASLSSGRSKLSCGSSRTSSTLSTTTTIGKSPATGTNTTGNLIEIQRAECEVHEIDQGRLDRDEGYALHEIEFKDPVDEDLRNARCNAKWISKIVDYKWKMLVSKLDSKYLLMPRHTERNDSCLDKDDIERKKQCSYEEIIAAMEDSLSYALKLQSDLPSTYEKYERSCSKELESINLELHVSQIKCLQYAEALWNDSASSKISGFVLDGPIASGKTFSSCALLWRRRETGPQLLICSSLSMTRWSHELKRFDGLNVITFGDFMSRNSKDLKRCDIIVCEVSAVNTLGTIISSEKTQFSTIVVDVRCIFASNAIFDQRNVSDISSCAWWSNCIKNLLRVKTKTVLVTCTRTMDLRRRQKIIDTLRCAKDVEMLSLKLAFIQHHLFHSDSDVFAKRVFRWAKKQHLELKNQTVLEGSSRLFSNCCNGKGILSRTMEIFTHMHEEVDEDLPSVFPNWFVQFCPLTPFQRESYERDCNSLRGSLICSNDGVHENDYGTFAKSLLRLRRSCFISNHSNSLDLIKKSEIVKECQNFRKYSQPNIDIAKSLLERSSKLQQLFNILCKDCGFEVVDAGVLLTVPQKGGKRKKKRKKVLILSCLPDILQTTSIFLDAVGIGHELILPTTSHSDDTSKESNQFLFDSLLWRRSQEALARFEKESESNVSIDVLLSSPETVGSMSLGLSAANADVVISLDEDWSGRSNLQLYSTLMKNCIQADSSGGRKYIKLIAEDTCEESFLTFTKKMKARSSIYPIPLFMSSIREASIDEKGFLAVKEGDIDSIGSMFCSNVLRCSNVPLSTIMCTNSSIPPISGTGSTHLFLEDTTRKMTGEYSTKANADLISLGSSVPSLIDDKENRFGFIPSNDAKKVAMVVTSFLVNIEADFTRNAWNNLIEKKMPRHRKINNVKNAFERFGWSFKSTEAEFYLYDFSEKVSDFHSHSSQQTKLNKPSLSKSYRKKDTKRNSAYQVKSSKSRKISTTDSNATLTSLLMYTNQANKTNENCVFPSKQKKRDRPTLEEETTVQSTKKRQNIFALSYSSMHLKQDGNQGIESSIYYPPLFPTPPGDASNELLEDLPALLESSSRKRKAKTKYDQLGKKIRSSKTFLSPGKCGTLSSEPLPHETALSMVDQKDIDLITSTDADFMATTSALFDDEFLPDLALDKVTEVIEENEYVKPAPVTVKPDLNEDFGLIGSGTLSSHADSLISILTLTLSGNPYSYWLDPFEPLLSSGKEFEWHSDVEEASNQWKSFQGPQLDSIILKVKAHQRSSFSNAKGTSCAIPGMSTSFTPQGTCTTNIKPALPRNPGYLPPEATRNTQIVNQITQNKKKKSSEKRIVSSPIPYSHPHGEKNILENSFVSKAPSMSMKHAGLQFTDTIGREREYRKSLTPFFCRPYVLLSKDLVQTVISSLRTGLSGRNQSSSSLVYVKPICTDGEISNKFIEKLDDNESASTSPFNTVNFAPFSCGVINESKDYESSIPITSCAGINLPMGVKVSHRHKALSVSAKNLEPWLDEDITILDKCSRKFDHNWHLASQILSSSGIDTDVGLSVIRSARQCAERWNLSVKVDENLISTEKRLSSDRIDTPHEDVNNSSTEASYKEDSNMLSGYVSVIATQSELVMENRSLHQKSPSKVQLGRLRTARLKRRIIPLTVPGYNNGGSNPSIQTHPSHAQSVQTAVNMAANSSGLPPSKLEMWPLQFLDVAEKQRQNIVKRNTNDGQHNQQNIMNSSRQSQHVHGMAPSHQNAMVQQQPVSRAINHSSSSVRNPAITSPHRTVARSQEAVQTIAPTTVQHQSSSAYIHSVNPNTGRVGNNRR